MKDKSEHKQHEREITLEKDDLRHDEDEFDSIAGEEDPGAGLEELVEYEKSQLKRNNEKSQ